MSVSFMLVHSPLVGPSSWRPVARLLAKRGHQVVVPSLRETTRTGPPYAARQVTAAVRAGSELAPPVVVAGHSGAGPLLPGVGTELGADGYLFVDAAPPRPGRSWFDIAPVELVNRLTDLAGEGWLPPWHEWFPAEVLEALLPGPVARRRFVAELEPLPVAMFQEPAPAVPGWSDRAVPTCDCLRPMTTSSPRRGSGAGSPPSWPGHTCTPTPIQKRCVRRWEPSLALLLPSDIE